MNHLSCNPFLTALILACCIRVSGEAIETLTIDKCVSIALQHNPQIAGAKGNSNSSHGGFYTARSTLLPQVSLQSGYTAFHNGSLVTPTTSVGIQAQQLLLDFGKAGKKTKSACLVWNAGLSDETSIRQTVAMNAEIAYIDLVSARTVLEVNVEALQQAQAHLTQATALFEAGSGVKFNVVKAEVDTANARLNILKAQDDVQSAFIQLELALGTPLPDSIVLSDTLSDFVDTISPDSSSAVARRSKPELISARLKRDAAAAQLVAAQLGRLPVVSANGGYSILAGDPTEKWSPSWNLGANLTFPLFTGGALTGVIIQARGSLDIAQASADALEQSVVADVDNQSSMLREAILRATAARKAVELAQLALSLAQERFNAGVGSPLEITDAELSLTNAQTTRIQAQADCHIASARLRRAMGVTGTPQ